MKTVHVRIAVAVAADGSWDSHGYGFRDGTNAPDLEAAETAMDGVAGYEPPIHVRFVECDVPMPEPEQGALQGKVTE
jgi:hypothetical protein